MTKKIKMKRILTITTLALGLLVTSGTAIAQDSVGQKLGHVDFQSIVSSMPETEAALAELEAMEVSLNSRMEELQLEYQAKLERLQTDTSLSYTVQQDLYSEIVSLEDRIYQFEGTANQELQMQESNLLKPIYDDIQAAITTVAEEGGFTYIIEAQMLYYMQGEDITGKVKQYLGLPGE